MTPTTNTVRTWLVRHPDVTLEQVAHGLSVSLSTVRRAFGELGARLDYRGTMPRRFALHGYRWTERVEPPGGLGTHQRRVYELLLTGPQTETAISASLGLTRAETRKRLRALHERSLVALEDRAPLADVWSVAL